MKLHSLLSALLLTCTVMPVCAEHSENRRFLSNQLELDRQRFRALPVPGITTPGTVAPQDQSFIDDQAAQLKRRMQPEDRPVAAALVFVSFSMPPDELKQRVRDAAQLNIPVVIRGMVNGDMRTTANAVAQLVRDTNTGGVQIDPVTFRQYGISAVPVVVVTCGSGGKTLDRLAGDVTLPEALKRISEDGECVQTAKDLLAGRTP